MPPTESPVGRSVTVSSLMTSSQEPLPGKTWVVLADEEGGYNVTLPLGFGKYTAGQPRTDGFLQFCILFLLLIISRIYFMILFHILYNLHVKIVILKIEK